MKIKLIAIYYCWMPRRPSIAFNNQLFNRLRDRNMCPIVLRLLLNMYINKKIQVKWNIMLSNQYIISHGVKQGGCISPTLLTIYKKGLI